MFIQQCFKMHHESNCPCHDARLGHAKEINQLCRISNTEKTNAFYCQIWCFLATKPSSFTVHAEAF